MNGGTTTANHRHPRAGLAVLAFLTLALGACSTGGDEAADVVDQEATDLLACREVDPQTWTPFDTDEDLATIVGAGEAPHPITPDAVTGMATVATLYPTPDDFLAQSNVPDPAARRAVMVEAGYRAGIEAEWAGGRPYDVQILNFRDADAVADYLTVRLPNICQRGGARTVTRFADGDGITWVDPLGAIHGEFILGSNQVSLVLCECDDREPIATMQAWHDRWLEQYGQAVDASPS